jgi:hypothetical protein
MICACFWIGQIASQARNLELFDRDVQIRRFASLHSKIRQEGRPPEANPLFRLVMGHVDDLSATYENCAPITVIHILELCTDLLLKELTLLQVRLCGSHNERLRPTVLTNITLIYDLASNSKRTNCLRLIGSDPREGRNKWQAATADFSSKTD